MKLKAFTYSIPFKKPFKTGTQTFLSREGIIFELKKDGFLALGEAAPLPGFSLESLQQVKEQLKKTLRDIETIFTEDLSLQSLQVFHRKNDILPSLQFALDTLAVNYLSQEAGISVPDLLFDNSPKKIPVNGVVSSMDTDKTLESVKTLAKKGFNTVKLKIGRDFENELTIIKKIRSTFPELTIRLDANKAWSLEEASKNLGRLDQLNIEHCEEPLKLPSSGNLRELCKSVATPIALDESLTDAENMDNIAPHIAVMVIKPMVFGSLSKLFATKRLAEHHDNKVIYTTSLESGIGRTMTAILAAGLGSRDSAHGLATGSLLKMDVWHDGTYINNGSVSLPDRNELDKRYHSYHTYLELVDIDL